MRKLDGMWLKQRVGMIFKGRFPCCQAEGVCKESAELYQLYVSAGQ